MLCGFCDPFLEQNLLLEISSFARRNVKLFAQEGCQEIEGIGLVWPGSGSAFQRYLGLKRLGGFLQLIERPGRLPLQAFSYILQCERRRGDVKAACRLKLHHIFGQPDPEGLTVLLFRLMAANARAGGR